MFEYESWLYEYAGPEGGVLLYEVWERELGSPVWLGIVGDGVFGPFEEDAVV